eukprot:893617-Rhodomonas_salina.2
MAVIKYLKCYFIDCNISKYFKHFVPLFSNCDVTVHVGLGQSQSRLSLLKLPTWAKLHRHPQARGATPVMSASDLFKLHLVQHCPGTRKHKDCTLGTLQLVVFFKFKFSTTTIYVALLDKSYDPLRKAAY